MAPKRDKRRSLSDLATLHRNQILTLSEWCAINGISPRAGRRLRASGDGPIETRLCVGRIGVTVQNNARWQKARSAVKRGPAKPKRRAAADQPELDL
jgi:hypothetical protein